MKYIKTFENNINNGKVWMVKTKSPDLEISLQKIKLYNRIYIYKHTKTNTYSWIEVTSNTKINMNSYEYMGEVIITKDDIEKYELEQDSKKYNL